MFYTAKPETPGELEAYFDLRWRVLRAPWGQSRGSEKDSLDDSADHVTVWDDVGRLVGVGRLHSNGPSEAQIRYMATEVDRRGLGIGREIIGRLEALAKGRGAERIVLDAREDAVGFYERMGYRVTGVGPTLFRVVKHLGMEKRLR